MLQRGDGWLPRARGGLRVAYAWVRGAAALAAVMAALDPTPLRADDMEEERSPLSTVIFGSLEAGPTKTFGSVGFKRAIGGGLGTSGFRLMTKAGGSQEEARRDRPRGLATKSEAQALLGYEWRIGDTFVALYAGSDIETERRELTTSSSFSVVYGARLHGDLWTTPTDETMLHASGYISSVNGRVWARVAGGWLLPPALLQQRLYLGPEIEAYREPDYHKLRLGVHVTGLRLLGLEWRLSGGMQSVSDRPAEAYATLGLHWLR